ncbi:autoinducer 2 ABC transporter substrate-binding protein [Robertmurraya korlensis]|uniref:autoinducer 2 ABC transporter substrate-binding protein n=1 Tax=Robertmurraya korlensis TaxID=519977 RepID=UPI00203FE3EF|nr:autoinducer 2 ABC transporter substrate-binding protein [Robertmurraya korlensis]MCM3602685.1 autoinducer 2 ABC transporter substrate-binding protein [Robertmurraya korlensis]
MARRTVTLVGLFILVFVSGCNTTTSNKGEFEVVYSKGNVKGETEKIEERQYTIAIVPKLVNIPYFNAVEEGALEAGEELGVKVIYKGPTVADSTQQIKVIEELIDQKVDVIAVSANDPDKLVPVLKRAQRKDIKVITWDSDTHSDSREFFINMVNPETLGRHLMDTLAWNVDETGEFAIITGSKSAANLNVWLNWIKVQQREYYPNMKLVEVVASDDDPHKAYMLAKDLLAKYPNLKGIIGNSSVGPPAAAQAVKEEGKMGEVAVVGLSSPNPMNEYLKVGAAQVVTLWSPKKLGYLTVALATNLVDGVHPSNQQDVPQVGRIHVIEDTVIMGEPMDFTKENVDQYDF